MFSPSTPLSKVPPILLKPEYLELMLSLATLPLLVALLGQQQLFKCFITLGNWSEGILQGISLPFLDLAE